MDLITIDALHLMQLIAVYFYALILFIFSARSYINFSDSLARLEVFVPLALVLFIQVLQPLYGCEGGL